MNYPDEGLEVLILNPNTNDWEFAYHKNNQWWQGVADEESDKLVDFIPSKWKYRYE